MVGGVYEAYVPKKGRTNAKQTVEATSAVLRRIKTQILSESLEGSNSSMPLAIGFINKAYLHSIKEANSKRSRIWKLEYWVV